VTRALAVVACLAIALPARAGDRGEWMVAARAGAAFADALSPLAPSFLAGVEVGWALPFWKHRLVIVADAAVSAPEASGTSQAFAWHATLREIGFGLELYYRHPIGRFTPYLGAGPRLLLIDSIVDGAAGSPPSSIAPTRETSAHVGAGVTPGLAFTLGPGHLFLDLPLTFAPAVTRTTGAFLAGSVALAVGYRLWF
jgi:hypothetical protein